MAVDEKKIINTEFYTQKNLMTNSKIKLFSKKKLEFANKTHLKKKKTTGKKNHLSQRCTSRRKKMILKEDVLCKKEGKQRKQRQN